MAATLPGLQSNVPALAGYTRWKAPFTTSMITSQVDEARAASSVAPMMPWALNECPVPSAVVSGPAHPGG